MALVIKSDLNEEMEDCLPVLEVSMDTTDRELKSGSGRSRDGFGLGLAGILACFTSSHFRMRSELKKSEKVD
jgi:hypothetical protein